MTPILHEQHNTYIIYITLLNYTQDLNETLSISILYATQFNTIQDSTTQYYILRHDTY